MSLYKSHALGCAAEDLVSILGRFCRAANMSKDCALRFAAGGKDLGFRVQGVRFRASLPHISPILHKLDSACVRGHARTAVCVCVDDDDDDHDDDDLVYRHTWFPYL